MAAILPQSRNLRARLPRRQPVTTPMASVAQRSISTKVTRRLRSRAAGLVDAKTLAAEHGHADAEDLPGAEMAMRRFGHGQEFVERFHCFPDAMPVDLGGWDREGGLGRLGSGQILVASDHGLKGYPPPPPPAGGRPVSRLAFNYLDRIPIAKYGDLKDLHAKYVQIKELEGVLLPHSCCKPGCGR